jgi:hypothetical protein
MMQSCEMVWTIPEEGRSASGHIGKGKLRRVKVNALRAETNKPLNECNRDLSSTIRISWFPFVLC